MRWIWGEDFEVATHRLQLTSDRSNRTGARAWQVPGEDVSSKRMPLGQSAPFRRLITSAIQVVPERWSPETPTRHEVVNPMLMASRYRPGGRKPVTTNDPRSASGESPVRFHHDDIVRDTIASGGGKGIRTPDLLTASQALYQLSYTPEGVIIIAGARCHPSWCP